MEEIILSPSERDKLPPIGRDFDHGTPLAVILEKCSKHGETVKAVYRWHNGREPKEGGYGFVRAVLQ